MIGGGSAGWLGVFAAAVAGRGRETGASGLGWKIGFGGGWKVGGGLFAKPRGSGGVTFEESWYFAYCAY